MSVSRRCAGISIARVDLDDLAQNTPYACCIKSDLQLLRKCLYGLEFCSDERCSFNTRDWLRRNVQISAYFPEIVNVSNLVCFSSIVPTPVTQNNIDTSVPLLIDGNIDGKR